MERIQKAVVSIVLFACCSGVVNFAQTKSDFDRSLNSSGCGLIPYSTQNDRCYKLREWIVKYCKGDAERGCNDLTKAQKSDIEQRIDNASNCIKYRVEVKAVYEDTQKMLGNESAPEIKPIAEKLIEKIKAESAGHDIALGETAQRKKICEEKE
jgi:hypothetical protein